MQGLAERRADTIASRRPGNTTWPSASNEALAYLGHSACAHFLLASSDSSEVAGQEDCSATLDEPVYLADAMVGAAVGSNAARDISAYLRHDVSDVHALAGTDPA